MSEEATPHVATAGEAIRSSVCQSDPVHVAVSVAVRLIGAYAQAFWCPACAKCWCTPNSVDTLPAVADAYKRLQAALPIILRSHRPIPDICDGCGAPPHVEEFTDGHGQGWVVLCLSCGWRKGYGDADSIAWTLRDVVRDLKPEFRNRSLRTQLVGWLKGVFHG